MGCLWDAYGTPMGRLWDAYGTPMGRPCWPHPRAMTPLLAAHGAHTGESCGISKRSEAKALKALEAA
eukprot:3599201-Alexandrium_andersonii.AAC.1